MSKLSTTQRTLLIMVAVFALPYLASWFLFLNPGVIDLGGRSNGTLISPLIGPDEAPFVLSAVKINEQKEIDEKIWTLLMFGSGPCQEACQKTMFTLQQLRKMMGLDKVRIDRAYVQIEAEKAGPELSVLSQYEGTEVIYANSEEIPGLEQKLGVEPGQLHQHILIADPGGNLVMLYPQDMDPKKIFADIEILFGRVKGV